MRDHDFWFAADYPANPAARFFKKAGCDSPSPGGEGRGEDGRKKLSVPQRRRREIFVERQRPIYQSFQRSDIAEYSVPTELVIVVGG